MVKLLGILLIIICVLIIRKRYCYWRKAKFMAEMNTILTIDACQIGRAHV